MIKMLAKIVSNTSPQSSPITDISKLDESFKLLRATTLEVSKEAVNAAKVLENRLKESEFRFLSTIDAIADLVTVKDSNGCWITLNAFGQRLFGLTRDQYYGKTNRQLMAEFPHLKDSLNVCERTDFMTWEHKKSFRYDETVETFTGMRYFDVIKTPVFNYNGTPKELIIVGRDVTEAREKHRRTKACFTALNSASDMIVIVDNNMKVFFCNDRFLEYFDVDDYNNCVGERLIDYVPNIPDFSELVSHVEENHIWEYRYDGRFKLTVLPMMNGVPKPIYYVFTFKEITGDKYTVNIGDTLGTD